MPQNRTFTELLEAWGAGDEAAAEQAVPYVYDELRSLARAHFVRERRGHTLQPTALVHEAWVRLVEQTGVRFRSRAHFVGLAAHVMRRVLIDHARERNTAKRGGRAQKVSLIEADAASEPDLEIMALDEAARLMVKHDVGRLPVVANERVIGIITRSDAMLYFYDLLPD